MSYDNNHDVSVLIGKTLASIKTHDATDGLIFTLTDGT
jgi:hypothetical protein